MKSILYFCLLLSLCAAVIARCRPCNRRTEYYSSQDDSIRSVCYLPKKVGVCRAAFTRYYYNPSRKNCFTFIWGGCGGNGNNFESYDDCMAVCKGA
ncbi:unnamed protein product [Larinioides sclopetarius]|uniref:BPTI/Kunitz inhibitor domain-containing protein n=1 Tax=Larinioides sclopetarius TaxID=280406 RepID=A0AAV2AQ30_9ARAC